MRDIQRRLTRCLGKRGQDILNLSAQIPITALYMMITNRLIAEVSGDHKEDVAEKFLHTLLVMALSIKLSEISVNLAKRICSATKIFNFKPKELLEIPLSAACMTIIHPMIMPGVTAKSHGPEHYPMMTAIVGTSMLAGKAITAVTTSALTFIVSNARACCVNPLATKDSAAAPNL